MTKDPSSSRTDEGPAATTTSDAASSPTRRAPRVTRASAAWLATGVALVLLILLIVFILQNSTKVEVQFLGMSGTIPLGMALLIAAVGGGVVVAVAGVARVTQLRMNARRTRRSTSSP
ncbi:MAG TPA: lipopolysaccharide assembly protein LapA domain-containing protein [Actinomycetes bacterium]|nr:lipopolysaccharide assembly protein LapA domain-containing protein [Actinomycetes bacterium]